MTLPRGIFRGPAYSILSGVLLGVGFIVPNLWPLALIGIIPLVVIALDVSRSWRRTFFLGWLAGCVLYGLALYGVFLHTLPLDWMGIAEVGLQNAFAVTSWLLAALGPAVAIGVWAIAVRFFATRTWLDALLIPSLWVLAEVLWSFILYLQSHGPGNIFGNIDFTLGYIGYQLVEDVVLLQSAWLGGIFALSAIAAGFGTILYRIFHSESFRERRILTGVLGIGVCIWALSHVFFFSHPVSESRADDETVDFAILATDVVYASDPEKQLAEQMELVENARGADVVVLPEGAELFKKIERSGLQRPSGAGFYIDSVDVREDDGQFYSRVEYYDPSTKVTEHTYKRFLLPIGEFIPYIYFLAGSVFGFSDSETFQKLVRERQHVAGAVPESVITPGGVRVGVLFCNESMSPTLYRSLTKDGAEVLVNVASHLWFNRSHTVFTQMKHTLQVRAVENRRWLVQANNTVPATVIDEYGRVVAETSWDTPNTVLRIDVPPLVGKTPYILMGMWVLLFPIGIVCATRIISWRKKPYTEEVHENIV